ncbi:cerberus [Aquarana catesbeiana]|uniref:cerberus n=1 Tax=Aquarana catesbeiana TaxID=8400 RepID=UPI003CC98D1A
MWLQIFRLIIIFYTTVEAVGKELNVDRRAKNNSVPTHHHSTKNIEGRRNFVIHNFSAKKEHINLEARERNQEENRVAKFNILPREAQEAKTHSQVGLGKFNLRENKKNFIPQRFSKKKANIPEEQNAKKFWNYFVYKLNAAPGDFPHPVKTQEIQQEVCKTIPFSQNITHENCNEVMIQNNLCFGKCNSLHVPNQREELNICSLCRPFKFRMNQLKLNCTGSSGVLKVVMMVEECKCMVHRHNNHGMSSYEH